MKKLFFLIQLLLISTLLSAQLVNINPDSTGSPWWVYEVSPVTLEIQAEIDQIPKFVLSPSSAQTTLPLVVDNSQEIYMREVFSQRDGSCGQASGIGYTYTYEINRLRGLSANDTSDNLYPTHFTFNIVRSYLTLARICNACQYNIFN
jgi:hypothetical protein